MKERSRHRASARLNVDAGLQTNEREVVMENPLSNRELDLMNAFWRACNYLSVGMIYLRDNPLLREP